MKTSIADRRAIAAEQYAAGRSVREIASGLGVSQATVRLDLRADVIPMQRRGPVRGSPKVILSVSEVQELRLRVEALAAEGRGDREIGRIIGLSKTTVAKYRRNLGLAPRPPGRPPESPLPERRRCETCGETFQPRRHNVKQGGGRFCSSECMAQDRKRRDASRRFVTGLNARRAERIAELVASGALLTRAGAAERVGVTASSVDHYLRAGYLSAITIGDLQGQSTRLLSATDLELFRRTWLADATGKHLALRRNWLDGDFVARVYEGRGILERRARDHGLTVDQMKAVVRHDIDEKRRLFAPRRGRPKGSGQATYHAEWSVRATVEKEALRRAYAERESLGLLDQGERPPTESHAFLAVAEADFAEHPERWKDYPHAPGDETALHPKWEAPAVDRVRKGVRRAEKALQMPQTEIR